MPRGYDLRGSIPDAAVEAFFDLPADPGRSFGRVDFDRQTAFFDFDMPEDVLVRARICLWPFRLQLKSTFRVDGLVAFGPCQDIFRVSVTQRDFSASKVSSAESIW